MTTNLMPEDYDAARAAADAAYDAAKTPKEKYDAYRKAYDRVIVAMGVVRCPECYRVLSGHHCPHCGGD